MKHKILFVDFAKRGHHAVYMASLINCCEESEIEYLYAFPELVKGSKSSVWIDSRHNLINSFLLKTRHLFGRRLVTIAQTRKLAKILNQVAVREPGNHCLVFLNFLDNFLYSPASISILSKIRWCGLWLHPRFFRGVYEDKKFACVAKRSMPQELFLLDRGVVCNVSKFVGVQCSDFPDLTDTGEPSLTTECKEIERLARGRFIIGYHGYLVPHKGLIELIKFCVSRPTLFFVFVGCCHLQLFSNDDRKLILAFLSSPPENAFIVPEAVLDSARFNSFHKVCDALWAGYTGFLHSSNRLTKSAFIQKPLLASPVGYMGEAVREFGLGVFVNSKCAASIDQAVNEISSGSFVFNTSKAREYFLLNSEISLRSKLSSMIQGRQ